MSEPVCRPGSVTPLTLTCWYSPGIASDLLFYLSWFLISSGFFSPSGGTETELDSITGVLRGQPGQVRKSIADEDDVLALVAVWDGLIPSMRTSGRKVDTGHLSRSGR